jgi:endonuclease YncB( thermonuclease family)
MRRYRPAAKRPLSKTLADAFIFLAAAAMVLFIIRQFNQVAVEPGAVEVIDGDSMRRGADEIRLNGIDAPEYRQTCRDEDGKDWTCGKESGSALRGLVSKADVRCDGIETDRYGRIVADCFSGALSLNGEMVRLGWAIAYRQHSLKYVAQENEAKRAKRGIWRGTFEDPETWREKHRPALGAAVMPD